MPYVNPEEKRRRDRAYYLRNREKKKAQAKAYAKAHPEKVALYTRRHLGRKKADDKEAIVMLAGDPCAYCGGPSTGVDHIVPVSKGGDGTFENLTAACKDCNKTKHVRPLLHFLLYRAEEAASV